VAWGRLSQTDQQILENCTRTPISVLVLFLILILILVLHKNCIIPKIFCYYPRVDSRDKRPCDANLISPYLFLIGSNGTPFCIGLNLRPMKPESI
jgi:hypothetical protein